VARPFFSRAKNTVGLKAEILEEVNFLVEANNIEYGNIEDRNIEFDVK